MPTLIAHTNMDEDAIAILKEHFVHIMNYMEKTRSEIFLDSYENATPSYIESSKNF